MPTRSAPPPPRHRWYGRTLALAATVLCVACGGQPAPAQPPVTPGQPAIAGPAWPSPAPTPPGGPSISARQVCDPNDGQKDIAEALSLTPTSVTPPTWVDQLYTCRYNYPNGSFTLSVKELPGDSQTVDYINQLASRLGQKEQLDGIGQGAFWTTNGSLVARKDDKVLLVDVADLPPRFASPPQAPNAISRVIGTVIMGCWNGD